MAAAEASALSLDAIASQGIWLQRGDNDGRKVWGGKHRSGSTGTAVLELQQALRDVGVTDVEPDGDFGRRTQQAVRRFQWYLNFLTYRLRVRVGSDEAHGAIEYYIAPTGVQVDGFARLSTLYELRAWQRGGYVVTSPLVRMSLAGFSHITASPSFTVLAYPSASSSEILVHKDFVSVVGTLNSKASAANLTLRINQAFRAQNLPPTGAVVPPATKSQHLIGHALDLNIVDAGTVNTSAMFVAGNQTTAADNFIKAVKKDGIRWGGDFNPKDPPHFDDFVSPASEAYKFSYYLAQRSFTNQHPLRVV